MNTIAEILINVFNCTAYSSSISYMLWKQQNSKDKIVFFTYFGIVGLLDALTLDDVLKPYSMIFIGIALIAYLTLMEKKKLINALLEVTHVLTSVLICILFYASFVMLFMPTALGSWVYNIVIGLLQLATAILITPLTLKIINTKVSEKIKILSIIAYSVFIILYSVGMPNLIEQSFNTIYAVNSAFNIILIVYANYVIWYLSSIYFEKKASEKEREITLGLYKSMSVVWQEVLKDNHYYNGLLGTMTKYIDENDMSKLKEYFKKEILSNANTNAKNIDKIQNIHVELIRNMLYHRQKQAQSKNIKMNITVTGVFTDFNMDSFDLFRILNIYFDNAVEASEKCNNPQIDVEFENTYKNIKITISNNFKTETEENPSYNHGNGLKFAEELINKYNNVTAETIVGKDTYTQNLFIKGDN